MSEMMDKAAASQSKSAAQSAGLGLVGNTMSSGSGAGGGFGLNAPGAGPKVKHFASGGGGRKTVAVDDAVATAWSKVLDDDQSDGFVIASYAPGNKSLVLKETGAFGLDAFRKALGDGSQCLWGGFKCLGVDNRGSVVCKRPKFVFVQYMPSGASVMQRAKMGTHKGAVKDALKGAHLDVTAETVEDLDEADLCKRLQAATGAHKPNGYEFETDVFVASDFYGLGIGKDCKST